MPFIEAEDNVGSNPFVIYVILYPIGQPLVLVGNDKISGQLLNFTTAQLYKSCRCGLLLAEERRDKLHFQLCYRGRCLPTLLLVM